MKYIFTTSALCIILSIFLSSCNSKYVITKRRYSKGYYVEHVKECPAVAIPEQAGKKNGGKARVSVPMVAVQQKTITIPTSQTPELRNTAQTAKIEKLLSKVTLPAPALLISRNVGISEIPIIKSNASSDIRAYDEDGSGRAALSLLWIVIVVILILWLIGILAKGFGLGGLINILLVIALILLILWLLRIA